MIIYIWRVWNLEKKKNIRKLAFKIKKNCYCSETLIPWSHLVTLVSKAFYSLIIYIYICLSQIYIITTIFYNKYQRYRLTPIWGRLLFSGNTIKFYHVRWKIIIPAKFIGSINLIFSRHFQRGGTLTFFQCLPIFYFELKAFYWLPFTIFIEMPFKDTLQFFYK